MVAVDPGLSSGSYRTAGGILVRREARGVDPIGAVEELIDWLDDRKGVLLASTYEYPGRYSRWDIGFVAPPLELVARARTFTITALNTRCEVLIPALLDQLAPRDAIESIAQDGPRVDGGIRRPARRFS